MVQLVNILYLVIGPIVVPSSCHEKLPKLHVLNIRLVVSFSFALLRQPLISRPSVTLDKHAADGLESVRCMYS